MKNNLRTTEDLLEKGKNISLSVSEHDEMKSTLLSYARYHGMKNKPSNHISSFWMRGIVSASLVFMLFVSAGYVSIGSLPGEFLYPIKTNLVEELSYITKFTPISKLEYHHERYLARLSELQTLSERGEISEIALKDSQIELMELSYEVDELMAGEDKIEDKIALELVENMVVMSNVTEVIVRGSSTGKQLDNFEIITDELEYIRDGEVVDLIENGISTIEIYIQDQLSEIGEELTENDLEEVTVVRIADYIEDVEMSLKVEDYEDAVSLVSDAVILIKVSEYTDDYKQRTAQ